MTDIVVIGSLNMDFVVQVDDHPRRGETVLGRNFQMIPGGKGANQGCAAAKLANSHSVAMVGAVGRDIFGTALKKSLVEAGARTDSVIEVDAPTGVALISVDRHGQNSIIVASGANFALKPEHLKPEIFREARVALFQLETPLETVQEGLRLARAAGARTILDPAPAQLLPTEILSLVDILTPNESEAAMLVDLDVEAVILKLGEKGCLYKSAEEQIRSPGFSVQAIDTTAAGDCFNGALGVALAEERSMATALRFANAAAAISVTRAGAQPSLPKRGEVENFLKAQSG
jgi:ribokinase